MTVSPLSDASRPRAGSPRALLTLGALLLLPIVISFLLHWKAIAIDGGWLEISDDRAMLDVARAEPTLRGLLHLHGLHFHPTIRLVMLAMFTLFGTAWTPYGIALVLSHGLLGASVAAVIYRFGRSAVATAAVVLPLTVSWSLSSGVLTSFVYFNIYLLVCLIVLTPILVEQYARASPWRGAALLFAALTWSIFTILSGLLTYIATIVFHLGLKYTSGPSEGRARRFFTVTRRDLLLCCVIVVSLALYALAYSTELASVGWRLPVEMGLCEETTHPPAVDRYLYILSFGYFGFIARFGFGFLPTDEIGWHRYVYALITVLLLAASLLVVALPRVFSTSVRSAAVIVAGFVLLAMIAAAMVASGRSCVQLWHMRYNAYILASVTCAVGIVLGRILTGLPRGAALIASAVLIALSLLLTYHNVQAVLTSPWLVNRAPGFAGS